MDPQRGKVPFILEREYCNYCNSRTFSADNVRSVSSMYGLRM
jgi:hypothetical protein